MYSLGFWNIRGLNDLNKQKVVKWFMHNNRVGLFRLLETKLKPGNLLKKYTSICDGWSVSTNCSWHKGGRIWVLWKPSLFDIHFLSYSAQHIHMPKFSEECNAPWLWLGDFNTVLSPVERLGGSTSDAEMEHFQDCVFICCTEDIAAIGALFTWSNKQAPMDRVYSRLDRAMGNQE
ncbi:uncharacterized protein LOC141614210 [Silene latifolia]|uniref:uncharacterized protein LOC141614210 n=1 Tax=Silene latifolia TaxID=37657 RepID=UPI003D77BC55